MCVGGVQVASNHLRVLFAVLRLWPKLIEGADGGRMCAGVGGFFAKLSIIKFLNIIKEHVGICTFLPVL